MHHGCNNCSTSTEHKRINHPTHTSQVARISPLLMLAYATPTAVFALISLPPMVAHHLTTTRSTLHQQTVMATWDPRDGLKHH